MFQSVTMLFGKSMANQLPRRVSWQARREAHATGRLVRRKVRLAPLEEVICTRRGARAQDDNSVRYLAPALIGDADNARFEHSGVGLQSARRLTSLGPV